MSWWVTIPGQPVSVNHSYKRATIRTRGHDGRVREVTRMVKTDAATAYQEQVGLIVKASRPYQWAVPADSYVRIRFWVRSNPQVDPDNVKKLILDAVAKALGINDRWILTCDMANQTVSRGRQQVVLEIGLDGEFTH